MSDAAREVRWALTDAERLCRGLQLGEGAVRQPGGGLSIRCPAHKDRSPSCSVSRGEDGTLRVKCFSCQFTADAIGLIAQVRGLNVRDRDQFREALAEGAQIAGLHELEREILDGERRPERARVEPPAKLETRDYPPAESVLATWLAAGRVDEDREASRYLVGRCIDPEAVSERNLARVVAPWLPEWARYRGRTWIDTGHRVIVRAFDATGDLRSMRAIRVTDDDSPKRLPPSGYKAAGLALLNRAALGMVLGRVRPERVVIVEGEPDWIVRACESDDAVIGIGSGSWTPEFASRVPSGSDVIVRTHNDPAGDKYADQVIDSLARRCNLWRKTA